MAKDEEQEAPRAGGHPAPGEEVKECPNCGAKNGVEWTFCFHCRVPFEEGAAKAKKPSASKKKSRAKKKSKKG